MEKKWYRFAIHMTMLLLLISTGYINLQAQTYNGHLTLTMQAEVDSFNYTVVTGNLVVSGPGITNLNGLSELTRAQLVLIADNADLTDVSGLASLDSSSLSFVNNSVLTEINGLMSLIKGININIINNPVLVSLAGLSNLTTLYGRLFLEGNALLQNLEGLSSLESVLGFDMSGVFNGLALVSNPSLKNVDALSSLIHVAILNITDNDSLISLRGLSNLRSAINGVLIHNNDMLTEFCPLNTLLNHGVPGFITITQNGENPTPEEILNEGPCQDTDKSFIAVLLGKNEVPPVQTDGSGGGMFVINRTQDTLHFWIRICELDCPFIAAHFHVGAPGVPGPVVKTITQYFMVDNVDSSSLFAHGIWTSSDPEPLTPALVNELFAGNIYVNVHTTGHPMGEIRGQLTDDKDVYLYANLDGSQVVPPFNTDVTSEGNFILNGDGKYLKYAFSYDFDLDPRRAGGHFGKGAVGHVDTTLLSFTFPMAGDSVIGIWRNISPIPLTPELVADLLGCYMYVQEYQYNFPDDDTDPTNDIFAIIRGQIYKTEEMMMDYMTLWTAKNNADPEKNSVLNAYTLQEGKQFLQSEGEIYGYTGEKNIVDLTIDIGGNIYFLNNTWASMLYRVSPYQLDGKSMTSVYAKQMGRLRTFEDKLVWLTDIQYIKGKLYGLDSRTNKLYDINAHNAVVREIATLSSLDTKAAGLTLGADGNVYVLKSIDNNKSELWKFEKFPSSELSPVTTVSSLDKLESFTSHPNGRLYASDKSSLYEINLAEKTVGVLKNADINIAAMDFDNFTEQHTNVTPTIQFSDLSGVTAVEGFDGLPTKFSLSQNYPNPFNPATTIKYQLPEASYVKLNIYNSLGELVRTLVNETKNAGYYKVTLDASSMASGMYIYKIEAGSFVSSAKMILLK